MKSEDQQPSWNVEGLVTKIGSVLRNVVELFKIFLEFLESMDWVLRLSVPELGVAPFESGQRDGHSGTKIRSEQLKFARSLDITYVVEAQTSKEFSNFSLKTFLKPSYFF